MADSYTMRHLTPDRTGILLSWLLLLLGFSVQADESFPPSPSQPWEPRHLGDYENTLAHDAARYESNVVVAIDPAKVYTLPEVIDIAERNHPQTRVAWERARQAAKAVGLSESAYYPYLAA